MFYQSLSEEERVLVRAEHKVVLQVLGIKGMYIQEEDLNEVEKVKGIYEPS